MSTPFKPVYTTDTTTPRLETRKAIENHKKIARLLKIAANLHLKASIHYETNENQKALACDAKAKIYLSVAIETERADVKRQMDNVYV
jgi:hypothetical protein